MRDDPSHEEMTVRPARADDMAQVAAIFAHYVATSLATFEQEAPSLGDWQEKRARLADRGFPFLAVEREGRVLGFSYASPWREKPSYRHTAEDTVYVAAEAVGRGLGRLLLDALIAACPHASIRQLVAVVADTGLPASQALHRACGFREVGRLHAVGYKHNQWIDTILMQRQIDPPGSPV